MSDQATRLLSGVLRQACEQGEVPGVVAMAATSDRVLYCGACGRRSLDGAEEVRPDDVFLVASMTKAVTSAAAMRLVEDGSLELDRPIADYVPSFGEPPLLERVGDGGELRTRAASGRVTARQLLTHTAGFGYEIWDPLLRDAVAAGTLSSLLQGDDAFLRAPLVRDPGTAWYYGISTDWLGRLIETLRGRTLDLVLRDEILAPLGMVDTGFDAGRSPERRPAVHARLEDGSLVRAPLQTPQRTSFHSGGGGLSSTAPDYLRFLRALLRGGELDGARILEAGTIDLMARNHIGALEPGAMRTAMPQLSNDFDFFPGTRRGFGLGFLINEQPVPGGRSAGSLAWAGLFNTYFWLDRSRDVAAVLLTQILPFCDTRCMTLLGRFERTLYQALDRL